MSMAIAGGVIGAIGVVSNIVGSKKSSSNASASSAITQQASQIAGQQWNNQQQYNTQLQQLIQNPDSFLSSRTFQDTLNQGLTVVSRQMASQGYLGSGNEATALEQYGQTFAGQQLSQQEQLLASLTGLGGNAAGQTLGEAVGGVNATTNANNSTAKQSNGIFNSAEGVLGQVSGLFGGGGGDLSPVNVTAVKM